jgi:hypothetical protein
LIPLYSCSTIPATSVRVSSFLWTSPYPNSTSSELVPSIYSSAGRALDPSPAAQQHPV